MTVPTPGSILVIDDEPSIVRGLTRLLHRDGYRVAAASHGRDALAALQAPRSDVILGDLRMPELDGCAFSTCLLQRMPALCQWVIFLTGDSTAADSQTFVAPCGRPWLGKPYPIAALRSAIQQVLEPARRAQSVPVRCRVARLRGKVCVYERPTGRVNPGGRQPSRSAGPCSSVVLQAF
jgi:two-component system response regulator GlrR